VALSRNRTQAEAAADLGLSSAGLQRYLSIGDLPAPPTEPYGLGLSIYCVDKWIGEVRQLTEAKRAQR
jgi:hypothetical protein